MVSSISSSSDMIKQIMEQLMANTKNKMSEADTDGVKGLSQDELSSINTGNDIGASAFIKNLQDSFDKLDTNTDGQLSEDEISAGMPPKPPMGPPPGLDIENLFSDADTDGVSGLSQDELSSVDSSNGTKKNVLVEYLLNNFNQMDSDGDGQLSFNDIVGSVMKQEEADNASRASSSTSTSEKGNSDLSSTLSDLAEQFVKKLLDAYKDNSSLIGALDIAG